MPRAWIRKHKSDYYYRKAKEEEYRSRAAYKLIQVVNKYKIIKDGYVVVDLGAAPGGWLQVSRNIVGEKGYILGVDARKIQPIEYSNVNTIVGDIKDSKMSKKIKAMLPRLADVVISDLSPNISGIWELDHARQIDLAEHSLKIAMTILVSNGNFFTKIFQGDMLNSFVKESKKHFSSVKLIKPKASRSESAEIYFTGLGYMKI